MLTQPQTQSKPQAQPNQQAQPKPRIKPNSVVYWLRVLLAIVAGFANHFLGITDTTLGDLAFPAAIGLGLLIYLFSVFIVQRVLRYGELELKGKNRYLTLGGGTFIVLWIMISVLLNTLLG
jgi:hypothetical protein